MKTKEEIIEAFRKYPYIQIEDINDAVHHLSQPNHNPNKIDEERIKQIHTSFFVGGYDGSYTNKCVSKYNSILKDHQALQPLPSEMPKEFKSLFGTLDKAIQIWRWFTKHYGTPKSELQPLPDNLPDDVDEMLTKWQNDVTYHRSDFWRDLAFKYGTPTKKELVSVDLLEKEIYRVMSSYITDETKAYNVAKHLVNTYSLNPTKCEWWMDLKEGDKFMVGGRECKLLKLETTPRLYTQKSGYFEASDCTPYVEPSIHDKFMASLSDEQKKMYEQMKEVKG